MMRNVTRRQSRDPYIAAADLIDQMGEAVDRIGSNVERVAADTTKLAAHVAGEEERGDELHNKDVEIALELTGLLAKDVQTLARIVRSLGELVATHFQDHSG